MKQKIIHILIAITLILGVGFINIDEVKAANTASITVKPSVSSLVVGNNVTATVTVSSTGILGAWDFNVAYTSSKLRLISSTGDLRNVGWGDGVKKSATFTYTFKSIAAGSASIYISSASVADFESGQYITVNKGSTSVNIITKEQLEASYSKNNYLSKLEVVGATLSPAFDKNTMEYSVELAPETTGIVINATKEDAKSSVVGAGEIPVTDGDNRIEIKVTAENGSLRTYVITAKVKEYDPIEVTVGKDKLTVVRKKTSLTAPNNYTETTVTINEQEVPAFTSEITKYVIVGLKDSAGTIGYYIYNDDKKSFTLYQELKFNGLVFYPIENEKIDIPKGYKKTTITYNNVKVTAYKTEAGSAYALLYGMNVETGKKNFYLFDSTENTLQKHNDEETKMLNDKLSNFFIIIIALIASNVIFITLSTIFMIKHFKKKDNDRDRGFEKILKMSAHKKKDID